VDFHHLLFAQSPGALVVLHHTAITHGASGGWFYHELPSSGKASSVILSLFCATNQAYFMGILFLLAGYFMPGSRWSNSPSPAPSRALPVGYWPIR